MIQTYGENRICTICGKKLSMYNKKDYCHMHDITDPDAGRENKRFFTSKNPEGFYRAQYDYYGQPWK